MLLPLAGVVSLIMALVSLVFAEHKGTRLWLGVLNLACATVAFGLYGEIHDPDLSLLLARVNMLAVTLIGVSAYVVTHRVSGFPLHRRDIAFLWLCSLCNFYLVGLTDSYFTGRVLRYSWGWYAEGRPLFFITPLSILALAALNIYALVRNYSKAHPLDKKRTAILLSSYVFLSLSSLDFLPHFNISLLGISAAALTIPVFVILFAYASVGFRLLAIPFINKHRHFDFAAISRFLGHEMIHVTDESQLWTKANDLFVSYLKYDFIRYVPIAELSLAISVRAQLDRQGFLDIEWIKRQQKMPPGLAEGDLLFPLHSHQENIGWLVMGISSRKSVYSRALLRDLRTLASLIALSLASLRSRDQLLHMNRHLEQLVQDRTAEIRKILDNVRTGLVILQGPDLAVGPHYSPFMEVLMDGPIHPETFLADFLDRCEIGVDQKNTIQVCLGMIIGKSLLDFELNVSHLPMEAEMKVGNERRELELGWDPIFDENMDIRGMILAIRDVTEQRTAYQESFRMEKDLRILESLLSVGPNRFRAFLSSFALVEEASHDQAEALRLAHTLKGNARSLGFTELADDIHTLEQEMLGGKAKSETWQRVLAFRDELKRFATRTLGWQLKGEILTLDAQEVLKWVGSGGREAGLALLRNQGLIQNEIFLSVRNDVEKVAGMLGKPVPDLRVSGVDCIMVPALAHCFRDALLHLVANSLDHGIEDATLRLERGKAERGMVSVATEVRVDRGLRIVYRDDGQGLNLQALAKSVEGSPSPEALAERIFLPQISTRSKATAVSGRGVGMSAVRELLQKHGASIAIRFETAETVIPGFQSFAFVMEFPPSGVIL